MTDKQTPPDWVLIEAAKRCGREGASSQVILDRWYSDAALRALCDMIERYETAPVDRKDLCARKAMAGWAIELDPSGFPKEAAMRAACVRAIELYESGFGK
jgi:hypothetical protein